ncbi:hypothetical protein TB1_023706 [Malus domestica]
MLLRPSLLICFSSSASLPCSIHLLRLLLSPLPYLSASLSPSIHQAGRDRRPSQLLPGSKSRRARSSRGPRNRRPPGRASWLDGGCSKHYRAIENDKVDLPF